MLCFWRYILLFFILWYRIFYMFTFLYLLSLKSSIGFLSLLLSSVFSLQLSLFPHFSIILLPFSLRFVFLSSFFFSRVASVNFPSSHVFVLPLSYVFHFPAFDFLFYRSPSPCFVKLDPHGVRTGRGNELWRLMDGVVNVIGIVSVFLSWPPPPPTFFSFLFLWMFIAFFLSNSKYQYQPIKIQI